MTFGEINFKVQDIVGYKGLGFVQERVWNRSVTMFKVESKRLLVLRYSYYPPEGLRNLIVNGALRYFIIFPQVNKILMRVSEGLNDIRKPGYQDVTLSETDEKVDIQMSIWEHHSFYQDFIEDGVYHEHRLIAQCNVHKECIEKYALPFFDKYKTLEDVYDDVLAGGSESYIASRIPGYTPLKRLIILKLLNKTEYTDMREWVLRKADEYSDSSDQERRARVPFYLHLVQYLDSGQYLELDDKPFVGEEQKPSAITTAKPPLSVLPVNNSLMIRFAETSAVLANIGIAFNPAFSLNDYRHDINWKSWDLDTLEAQDFLYHLLLFAGTQLHDAVTDQYAPASPNVYFFNSEWDSAVDYGEIIERLNALTNNTLSFENIEGHFDDLIGVSFTYKGEPITWEFQYDNDWTDYDVFTKFLDLVKDDSTKEFYILIEGQGGLIFYFDEGDKVKFEQVFLGRELIGLREFVE